MKRKLLTVAGCLSAACQVIGGYEEFEAARNAIPGCSALPTSKSDERGLALMARIDMQGGSCVWMDVTEVTVGQFNEWLDDPDVEPIKWDTAWCSWKRTREDPATSPAAASCRAAIDPRESQPFSIEKPIRCVDWCEAEAFCEWASKRLCNDFGHSGTQAKGVPHEWREACSNAQTTAFPWGDSPYGAKCNTDQTTNACLVEAAVCGAFAVESWPECSSRAGVHDLLGNVAEWVYSCNLQAQSDANEPTSCLALGGAYDEPRKDCFDDASYSNDTRSPEVGFRCCDKLTALEAQLIRP